MRTYYLLLCPKATIRNLRFRFPLHTKVWTEISVRLKLAYSRTRPFEPALSFGRNETETYFTLKKTRADRILIIINNH